MRVTMLSKALVVGAYQRKCELIAQRPDIELTVLAPPGWRTGNRMERLERVHTSGYTLREIPIRWNGSFHLHYYPSLRHELAQTSPDIVHIDEEPYNLSTYLALRDSRHVGARSLFFTWQNIARRYPPPFRWFETYALSHVSTAIAGNQEAASVLRRKGYQGTCDVIPQFGVDEVQFQPVMSRAATPFFTVGYAGRLVKEKGVDLLLRAMTECPAHVRAMVIGAGDERNSLMELSGQLGLVERVSFLSPVPSSQMPGIYGQLDALVLPSRTQANWKEQFGRVLIEAMSCGVPVVGSQCGEIPNVIGDAGIIFPEDDVHKLAHALVELEQQQQLRTELGARGRARVMSHFTMRRIADETVNVYRSILDADPPNRP